LEFFIELSFFTGFLHVFTLFDWSSVHTKGYGTLDLQSESILQNSPMFLVPSFHWIVEIASWLADSEEVDSWLADSEEVDSWLADSEEVDSWLADSEEVDSWLADSEEVDSWLAEGEEDAEGVVESSSKRDRISSHFQ